MLFYQRDDFLFSKEKFGKKKFFKTQILHQLHIRYKKNEHIPFS